MSDFDYDELDKAMNSLDGDDSKLISSVNDSDEPARSEKPILKTVSVGGRAPEPSFAGRRSSGRFMDVVHPSSDMRAKSRKTPLLLEAPDDSSSEKLIERHYDSKPDSTNEPKPTEQIHSQPDSKPDAGEDADIEKLSADIDKTLGAQSEKVLETPFIPDVSVEKRPLGAFSVDKADESSPPENTLKGFGMDINNQSLDVLSNTSLPAELQSDLLSIESDTVGNKVPAEETAPTEPEKDTKKAEAEPIPTVSIPQQYQEKVTTTDQKVAPIYDNVQSYNKALLFPAKNKSWRWVIWIGLLIFIGAGIGVAAYFFLLSN